jgi:hypothetical protein
VSDLEPSDVTEALLPPAGSVWQDTYAYTERRAIVLSTHRAGLLQGEQVWTVDAMEDHGWRRTFRMYAHGFLSRYKRVESI